MLYKLSDALRIYFTFQSFEVENNSNKSIMQKAGAIGLILSAVISYWIFNNFNKRMEEKRIQDRTKKLAEKDPLD